MKRGLCKTCAHWIFPPVPQLDGEGKQQRVCTEGPPQLIVLIMQGRTAGVVEQNVKGFDATTLPNHECGHHSDEDIVREEEPDSPVEAPEGRAGGRIII